MKNISAIIKKYYLLHHHIYLLSSLSWTAIFKGWLNCWYVSYLVNGSKSLNLPLYCVEIFFKCQAIFHIVQFPVHMTSSLLNEWNFVDARVCVKQVINTTRLQIMRSGSLTRQSMFRYRRNWTKHFSNGPGLRTNDLSWLFIMGIGITAYLERQKKAGAGLREPCHTAWLNRSIFSSGYGNMQF